MSGLTATIGISDEPRGEKAVVLRIVNDSGAAVQLADPDLGRPADDADWPFSVQAYRAALLMSFGFLTVTVRDESGAELDRRPVSTWSTPLVPAPVSLPPAGTLQVVIPLGPFFAISPGRTYRVTAVYGETSRVTGTGTVGPDSTWRG
jgi:hypothetical protein